VPTRAAATVLDVRGISVSGARSVLNSSAVGEHIHRPDVQQYRNCPQAESVSWYVGHSGNRGDLSIGTRPPDTLSLKNQLRIVSHRPGLKHPRSLQIRSGGPGNRDHQGGGYPSATG
jgi:hypothetical protein